MSVNTETNPAQGQTAVMNKESVYASLFEKINLSPASSLGNINVFLDDAALSEATAGERLTAAMQVFMDCIRQSGQQVEKLDKTLIDHHIAELDFRISRQLDAVMHHPEFQKVESLWRGLKQLVDNTDYRQNVKTEILDVSKDDLRQDFEDAPELIQSGLYWHTYTAEYDTPGGEPIGSVISAYEFDASPQDMALLRNISKVSAAAHMPFIGAVGPKFFLKDSMEEVAAIKDIGNYFDRAEYIKWKSFRDTDDSRYIGLVMPRVSGLNEGLAILETLITRQWGSLWPQPVHARMEILCGLGKRLQQALRTLTLTYADLSLIYEVEAHLKALDAALQRLELKHASQFDALLNLMHNAAVRLENSDGVTSVDTLPHVVAMENASTHLDERVERTKWVYIAPPETLPHEQAGNERQNSEKRWRPFVAGMLTMLALAAAAGWGWQAMAKPEPEQRQFALSLAPLPTVLSPDQLRSFSQHAPPADGGIKQTRQQLSDLAQLKPNWAIDYSEQLVQQAQVLWPEQAKTLSSQWRQQIIAAALPAENLTGWYQGMQQLQQLTQRLDALDEQKGKYMTVSELKSAVFAITQSFNRTVPAEEQLRQLSAMTEGQISRAAQQQQAEQHLQQLIVSYALLKSKMAE
ncbi:EvpB/family type VI secretion protein [Klebsiella aerogenes UCI 48]|nr:EvpB/family type VI secretion protein [Klebsiella aerogenes UCI 48]EUL48289.1 EvpB/family type VI secretion protein [Klebsiella aerogenes UCI 47]HBV4455597.1 type VI secretion system contractile sheath large subunit [Klebsiella aerogenes]